MGRIFEPGMIPSGGVPEAQGMVYVNGQAFLKGAVLIFGAGQAVTEGGANPAAIVGVALQDAGSNPGFSLSFDSKVISRTGTVQDVAVAKANRMTIFTGRMVNGGTDPVVPAQTDIGISYNILKTGANEWVVDQSATAAARVKIIDIDIPNKLVLFRFLEANLAQP